MKLVELQGTGLGMNCTEFSGSMIHHVVNTINRIEMREWTVTGTTPHDRWCLAKSAGMVPIFPLPNAL